MTKQTLQKILVTGSAGFIGKNLVMRARETGKFEVIEFDQSCSVEDLPQLVSSVDAVFHLAGENRPKDTADFARVNTGLTKLVCDAIKDSGRQISLILTSSIQAELDNPYGRSKRDAESLAEKLAIEHVTPVIIYRLPGVFGKWCRPNYNSVVATFCHNIACGLPIEIRDPDTQVQLVYIDDVVDSMVSSLNSANIGLNQAEVATKYSITLGALANQISAFDNSRKSLISEPVGTGFVRALYATYVSYLPKENFTYEVPKYGDERGIFVEMLKTPDCGQFSYFTAHPGITRGGHYHHSKTEKFLVIKGKARFGFRHMITKEYYEAFTSGDKPEVVETVPGWTHDITNIGEHEMIVMLWANEIFDRAHPDTITCKVRECVN